MKTYGLFREHFFDLGITEAQASISVIRGVIASPEVLQTILERDAEALETWAYPPSPLDRLNGIEGPASSPDELAPAEVALLDSESIRIVIRDDGSLAAGRPLVEALLANGLPRTLECVFCAETEDFEASLEEGMCEEYRHYAGCHVGLTMAGFIACSARAEQVVLGQFAENVPEWEACREELGRQLASCDGDVAMIEPFLRRYQEGGLAGLHVLAELLRRWLAEHRQNFRELSQFLEEKLADRTTEFNILLQDEFMAPLTRNEALAITHEEGMAWLDSRQKLPKRWRRMPA